MSVNNEVARQQQSSQLQQDSSFVSRKKRRLCRVCVMFLGHMHTLRFVQHFENTQNYNLLHKGIYMEHVVTDERR